MERWGCGVLRTGEARPVWQAGGCVGLYHALQSGCCPAGSENWGECEQVCNFTNYSSETTTTATERTAGERGVKPAWGSRQEIMRAQIERVSGEGKEGSSSGDIFKGKLRQNLVAVWVQGIREKRG